MEDGICIDDRLWSLTTVRRPMTLGVHERYSLESMALVIEGLLDLCTPEPSSVAAVIVNTTPTRDDMKRSRHYNNIDSEL